MKKIITLLSLVSTLSTGAFAALPGSTLLEESPRMIILIKQNVSLKEYFHLQDGLNECAFAKDHQRGVLKAGTVLRTSRGIDRVYIYDMSTSETFKTVSSWSSEHAIKMKNGRYETQISMEVIGESEDSAGVFLTCHSPQKLTQEDFFRIFQNGAIAATKYE